MIAGTFKSGSIDPVRDGYMGEGTKFRLQAEFSYGVADSTYSGEYARDFLTEDEAISLQRSLHQGPLYVRYNPASPAEYVLDPYRDVWQPGSEAISSSETGGLHSANIESMRIGRVNWWNSQVSLGRLLIFQVAAALVFSWVSERAPIFFWFMAGAYAVWAITTKGCCWWTPGEKTLPTWIGRTTLIAVACGWAVCGAYFSN